MPFQGYAFFANCCRGLYYYYVVSLFHRNHFKNLFHVMMGFLMNPPNIGMPVMFGHFNSALPLLCQRTGQSSRQQNGFKMGHSNCQQQQFSRWWQLKYVFYSDRNYGKMIQFDERIFQMGW